MWKIDNTKLATRLATRGIATNNDPEFMRMIPWTRFTYAVSGLLIAVATTFGFAPTLWVSAFFAGLAVITPHHLFEYFYNHVLRRFTGTKPLPSNKAPTKFAFGMMSVCLVLTATAFQSGYACVGMALGAMIVFFAGLVSISHICVPAEIFKIITRAWGTAQNHIPSKAWS